MLPRHLRVLPTLAAATFAASLAMAGSPAAHATPQPQDQTVQIQRTFEEVVDLGAPGNSHGDLRITRGVVRNESGKRIGTYATSQTVIWANVEGGFEERSLVMRVTVGGSEITMVGMIMAPDSSAPSTKFVIPIEGGTGKYFGAQGTLTLIPRGNGVSTLKFDFA